MTMVSRNSCRRSIFLPSTRRNRGNDVNHLANLHTIRRNEKSQGNQGCIWGSASWPLLPVSTNEAGPDEIAAGSIYQTNEESANPQRCARLKRSALPTTDTELKLMAAVAMIGLSRMPKNG